jgi:hypothetical protein
MFDDWAFFVRGWGIGFTVYLFLQLLALVFVRGWRRAIVAIPAPFMAAVFVWTEYAARKESNLWPIVMILTSPAAALIVVLLWIGVVYLARQEKIAVRDSSTP